MDSRIVLNSFDYNEALHPQDRKMMERLMKIPRFADFLNATVVKYDSIFTDIEINGNGYNINTESMPHLYQQYIDDCRVLNVQHLPKISSIWGYLISSDTTGGTKPRISLSSGAIDLLTESELNFLIGHELGHILTGHKPFHTLLDIIYSPLINQVDTFSIASIIKLPLLEWYRFSHFSADRIGLLCCQDINAALTAMIKMSGCPIKYYDKIDIQSFLNQGIKFQNSNQKFIDSMGSSFIIRSSNLPWMVLRAKELNDWYQSGEYALILSQNQ